MFVSEGAPPSGAPNRDGHRISNKILGVSGLKRVRKTNVVDSSSERMKRAPADSANQKECVRYSCLERMNRVVFEN